MLNDLQIVSDLISIIISVFTDEETAHIWPRSHNRKWGIGTHSDWLQINREFVATYIIMVKVSFVAIWVNSLRVSTSSKDAQMAGRIRKENQNSREAENRKSPKINVKELKIRYSWNRK